MRLIVSFFLFFVINFSYAQTINPFESDGCSSFPNGTFKQKQLWLSCCEVHDYAYWKGGTYADRFKSDVELKQCVHDAGESEIGIMMLAGVRVGGNPFINTSFRWGYGWPYPRFYQTLTQAELKQISDLEEAKEKTLPAETSELSDTIKPIN